jgi:hypothetical protein
MTMAACRSAAAAGPDSIHNAVSANAATRHELNRTSNKTDPSQLPHTPMALVVARLTQSLMACPEILDAAPPIKVCP